MPASRDGDFWRRNLYSCREHHGFSDPREPNGVGMFGLAVFGIAVNGFAAWRLGQGHSHNEQMLKWHLIEDVLGWVAVLFGSALIYFFGGCG